MREGERKLQSRSAQRLPASRAQIATCRLAAWLRIRSHLSAPPPAEDLSRERQKERGISDRDRGREGERTSERGKRERDMNFVRGRERGERERETERARLGER